MKLIIDAKPKHWYIEKREKRYAVSVRFEGVGPDGNKFEFRQEAIEATLDDAVVWLKEQLEA